MKKLIVKSLGAMAGMLICASSFAQTPVDNEKQSSVDAAPGSVQQEDGNQSDPAIIKKGSPELPVAINKDGEQVTSDKVTWTREQILDLIKAYEKEITDFQGNEDYLKKLNKELTYLRTLIDE